MKLNNKFRIQEKKMIIDYVFNVGPRDEFEIQIEIEGGATDEELDCDMIRAWFTDSKEAFPLRLLNEKDVEKIEALFCDACVKDQRIGNDCNPHEDR